MNDYFYGDDEEQLAKDEAALLLGCAKMLIFGIVFIVVFGVVIYLAVRCFA